MKNIPHYISYPLAFLALCVTLALLHITGLYIEQAEEVIPVPTPIVLEQEGTLGIGETLALKGVTVTLHSVVADYRCPVDVQCIQGGAIVAKVTLQSGALRETFNMPSDEVPRSFGAYRVSIINIAPPLYSTAPTDSDAYRITFRTEPMTETEQVEAYLRINISALSPEPAVLGGTFYVTEIAFPEAGNAVVSYEDGHIALVADVVYELSADSGVTVREFTLRANE
jgi:hypothetical protein